MKKEFTPNNGNTSPTINQNALNGTNTRLNQLQTIVMRFKNAYTSKGEEILLFDFFNSPQSVDLSFISKRLTYYQTLNFLSEGQKIVQKELLTILPIVKNLFYKKYSVSITDYLKKIRFHPEYKLLKKLLPACTISGTFTDGKRSAKNLFNHSGLIGIDIDLHDTQKANDFISQYKEHKNFLAIGLSASLTGVFIIVPILHKDKHLEHFLALQKDFESIDIKIDTACKNVDRLRFATDSQIYFNANVEPYQRLEKKTALYTSNIDIKETDNEIVKHVLNIANFKGYTYTQGNRAAYIVFVASLLNSFGLLPEIAINEVLKVVPDLDTERFLDIYRRYEKDFNTKIFNKISNRNEIEFSIEKYLSEIELNLDRVLSDNDRVILQSFAGTGKTEYIANWAKRTGKRVIICLPYQILTRQAETRFKQLGFVSAYGNSFNEDVINTIRNGCHVATTYDYVSKVIDVIGNDLQDIVLVIDEFHNIVIQASEAFRYRACNYVLNAIQQFKKVICLSATPEKMFSNLGFKTVYVDCKSLNKVSLYRVDYEDNKKGLAFHLFANREHDKINVIRFNNKSELQAFREHLLANNLANESEICCVYNTTFAENDTIYVAENQKLPEVCKFLLCTSKLTDGTNILNLNIGKVILVDENEPANIIQFVARFRNVKILDAYSLRKVKEQSEIKPFNKSYVFGEFQKTIQRLIGTYERLPKEQILHFNIKSEIFKNSKYIDYQKGINTLALMHDLHIQYRQSLSLNDFYNEITTTAKNIEVVNYQIENLLKEEIEATQTDLQIIRDSFKIQAENATTAIKEVIATEGKTFFEVMANMSKNPKLRNELKNTFDLTDIQSIASKNLEESEIVISENSIKIKELIKQNEKTVNKITKEFIMLASWLIGLVPVKVLLSLSDEIKIQSLQLRLKKLFAVYLYDNHKDLIKHDKALLRDIENLKRDITYLNSIESDISLEGLKNALNKNRFYRHEKLKLEEVKDLINALTNCQYDRHKKVYKAESLKVLSFENLVQDIENVIHNAGFTDVKINATAFVQNTVLKANELLTDTAKIDVSFEDKNEKNSEKILLSSLSNSEAKNGLNNACFNQLHWIRNLPNLYDCTITNPNDPNEIALTETTQKDKIFFEGLSDFTGFTGLANWTQSESNAIQCPF